MQLVEQCLANEAEVRPSAEEMLQQLEQMEIDDPYQNLTRLEMMRMVGQKEEEIRQTVEESQWKDRVIQCSGELLQQMVAETGRKEQTIQQKEEEIQRMSEDNYSIAWSCVLCVCTCLHVWVHLCIHIAIISCLVG